MEPTTSQPEPFILAFDPGIQNLGIAALGMYSGKVFLFQKRISKDKIRKNYFFMPIVQMLEQLDAETGGFVRNASLIAVEEAWAGKGADGVASDMFSIVNSLGAYFYTLRGTAPTRNYNSVAPGIIKRFYGIDKRTRPARKREVVAVAKALLEATGNVDVAATLKNAKSDDSCDALLIAYYFLANSDPTQSKKMAELARKIHGTKHGATNFVKAIPRK